MATRAAGPDIYTNLNSIPILSGTNFKKWKEFIPLYLSALDLDYALWNDQPKAIKDSSFIEEKKCTISDTLRDTLVEELTNAKLLLQEIEKRYHKEDKAETSTLIYRLTNMKYKRKRHIREYIIEMSHICSRLKVLNLKLPEKFIVYMALISITIQFNQFKVNYNCQKPNLSLMSSFHIVCKRRRG
ncbi:unnamed protein product [Spirodela intermedia]|uniref:Uncharacterized protein n=1 Tax=Spirodela intermedia TaxID=51605 RepID=A0A7I8IW70_SPIIN|nr:unnamed protein product [Spirodela intermedia]CAA6662020.1 unnamed protein product [Spirodela intermedia]